LSAWASKLIEVINQEITCLENFLTLLSEEQKFLVENDVNSLRRSLGDQEKVVRDAQKLENERIRLTDSLAKELKIDKGKVNISKLIELVEESYSTKLRELQSTLSSLYAKLERQRKKNEFLIKQSMKYVDKSMNIFLDLEGRGLSYSAPQQKNQKVHSDKVAAGMG
jgi:uncharacterized protein YeeX (DUF496 family)